MLPPGLPLGGYDSDLTGYDPDRACLQYRHDVPTGNLAALACCGVGPRRCSREAGGTDGLAHVTTGLSAAAVLEPFHHRSEHLTPRSLSVTHRPPAIRSGQRPISDAQPSATREKPFMRDTGEFLFTSESVSEGHPDKVADRLSDTVLDAYLAADPYSRVACETLVTTNRVVFAGETRGPPTVTPDLLTHLARMAIHNIGYDQPGFSWDKAEISCHLYLQSLEIAPGGAAAGNKDEGAGDEGMMF